MRVDCMPRNSLGLLVSNGGWPVDDCTLQVRCPVGVSKTCYHHLCSEICKLEIIQALQPMQSW